MRDPETDDNFTELDAINEFCMEAAPWPGNRWATAFKSRAGEYLVKIGKAAHEQQGPPTWVYKLSIAPQDERTL